MKLKVPKTERKRSTDSRFKRFLKSFVLVLIVVVLLGLACMNPAALGSEGECELCVLRLPSAPSSARYPETGDGPHQHG